jgi:hypothetical protein
MDSIAEIVSEGQVSNLPLILQEMALSAKPARIPKLTGQQWCDECTQGKKQI